MQRRRFQQVLENRAAGLQWGVPAKTASPGDCGRRGFYFHSDIDSQKKR